MQLVPLIPARLVRLAIALGGALTAAGALAPHPYGGILAGIGSVALYLGGLGWKAPAWAAGKPLLPVALVPIALSAHALLERAVPMVPMPWQAYGTLVLGVVALLAGKVLPEPVRVVDGASVANVEDAPEVLISTKCSLADAAQGKCQR